MPIQISFQPAAAAVGGLALTAGQGEYAKYLNDLKFKSWQAQMGFAQQAQQMAQARALALSQMANENDQRQQQQSFEMQKLPYQAAIESQQQAYQSGLQGQNQMALANQHAQLQSQQSTQDFGEAQRLQDAQGQMHLEGQRQMAAYNDRLKQQQQVEQMFQNPLAEHNKNVKSYTDQGYSFSPGMQKQRDDLVNSIQAIQKAVGDGKSGTTTRGDALPEIQKRVAQLNTMVPDQPPPETTQQKIAKSIVMGIPGADGKPLPGTENTPFTVDAKDGTPMVVRGWKADAGTSPTVDVDGVTMPIKMAKELQGYRDKVENSEAKRQERIDNEFMGVLQQQAQADMATGTQLARDPNWQAQTKAQITAKHQQHGAAAEQKTAPLEQEVRRRMGAADATQQQQQAQQGGAPQPPQPGIPGPQANGQPQAPPIDLHALERLKRTPREHWTLQDWILLKQAMTQPAQGQAA